MATNLSLDALIDLAFQLEEYDGDGEGNLSGPATVQLDVGYEQEDWVDVGPGSSVADLAVLAADRIPLGPVRVVSRIGEVLAALP